MIASGNQHNIKDSQNKYIIRSEYSEQSNNLVGRHNSLPKLISNNFNNSTKDSIINDFIY
jgi:hypothetical protein